MKAFFSTIIQWMCSPIHQTGPVSRPLGCFQPSYSGASRWNASACNPSCMQIFSLGSSILVPGGSLQYIWYTCVVTKTLFLKVSLYKRSSVFTVLLLKIHDYNCFGSKGPQISLFLPFCYTKGPKFQRICAILRLKVQRRQPNIPTLFRGECPPPGTISGFRE